MNNKFINIVLLLMMFLAACRQDYTPKPRGFMKLEYPAKIYRSFDTTAPFTFDYPEYAEVIPDTSTNAEKFWYNIEFPSFNGTIYLSYKNINNNLGQYIEDSRILAYKHSIKAEAIEERLISRPENSVYGLLYDLTGNTASSLQFYVTDSVTHFIRGSLYFNTTPQKDSLAPVVRFIREDVLHMIETLQWNDEVTI